MKNGGSFHSYVKLPEGTGWGPQDSIQLPYFSGFMVDITN